MMIISTFLTILPLVLGTMSPTMNPTAIPTAVPSVNPTSYTMSPTSNPTSVTSSPTIAAFPYCNDAADCGYKNYTITEKNFTLDCISVDDCREMTIHFYEFAYITCGYQSCRYSNFYCYKGCEITCTARNGCSGSYLYLYGNSTINALDQYSISGSHTYCYGCNILCNAYSNTCRYANFYFYNNSYLYCINSQSCKDTNIYSYNGNNLIEIAGNGYREFEEVDVDIYGGILRLVPIQANNQGSILRNRFTVHSQGTLIIECVLGYCSYLKVKNYGNLKLITNENALIPFYKFNGQNYNFSNTTVMGCNYTLGLCQNMTWSLYNNSNMHYINNYKLFPIYLYDEATCNICTGNVITQSPTMSPTNNPTSVTTVPTPMTNNPTSVTNSPSINTNNPTTVTFTPTVTPTYNLTNITGEYNKSCTKNAKLVIGLVLVLFLVM